MVDVIHNGHRSLSRTVPQISWLIDGEAADSRSALFGIDEIRYLEVESEVGLEVLRIHRVFCDIIELSWGLLRATDDHHIRIYRWRGVCEGSPKPPNRSLVAYRADAASILT